MWHLKLQLKDGFEFDKKHCGMYLEEVSDDGEKFLYWEETFENKSSCLEWVRFLNNSIVYLPYECSVNQYIMDDLIAILEKDKDIESMMGDVDDITEPAYDLWKD